MQHKIKQGRYMAYWADHWWQWIQRRFFFLWILFLACDHSTCVLLYTEILFWNKIFMYFFFTHNKIRALGKKIVLCLVKESRNYKISDSRNARTEWELDVQESIVHMHCGFMLIFHSMYCLCGDDKAPENWRHSTSYK